MLVVTPDVLAAPVAASTVNQNHLRVGDVYEIKRIDSDYFSVDE